MASDKKGSRPTGSKPTGRRATVRVKTARGRTVSSQRWLQRQLNDPYVAEAKKRGYRSRAAFKLLQLDDQFRFLKPGARVVDLGAAPGGWTWQLVRRGLHVTAVDNGPMDENLMASGQVTHKREDGFRFQPRQRVDWMVCDMVEQPRRVAERMAEWLAEGWCKHAVFNLKLPMKKRYAEVQQAFELMQAVVARRGREIEIRAKQLYHDREEITVFACER